MIEIKDLHKFYGEGEARAQVIKGITCRIDKGQICVLLGPSGSGKSTLLNILGGIENMSIPFAVFHRTHARLFTKIFTKNRAVMEAAG